MVVSTDRTIVLPSVLFRFVYDALGTQYGTPELHVNLIRKVDNMSSQTPVTCVFDAVHYVVAVSITVMARWKIQALGLC